MICTQSAQAVMCTKPETFQSSTLVAVGSNPQCHKMDLVAVLAACNTLANFWHLACHREAQLFEQPAADLISCVLRVIDASGAFLHTSSVADELTPDLRVPPKGRDALEKWAGRSQTPEKGAAKNWMPSSPKNPRVSAKNSTRATRRRSWASRRISGAGRAKRRSRASTRERLLIGATGFSPIREEPAYLRAAATSVEEVSKRFDALRGEAPRPAFARPRAMLLIFMAACLLRAHFTTWAVFDWVRAAGPLLVSRVRLGRHARASTSCLRRMRPKPPSRRRARAVARPGRAVRDGLDARAFLAGVGALGG